MTPRESPEIWQILRHFCIYRDGVLLLFIYKRNKNNDVISVKLATLANEKLTNRLGNFRKMPTLLLIKVFILFIKNFRYFLYLE